MKERGIVVAKQFVPEFEGSGIGYGTNSSGQGVVTSTYVHADERFCLAFQCEHGTIFTVNNKDCFASLEVGDTCTIEYSEVRWHIDSSLSKYDFITAYKQ